jgi:hypothetical protein
MYFKLIYTLNTFSSLCEVTVRVNNGRTHIQNILQSLYLKYAILICRGSPQIKESFTQNNGALNWIPELPTAGQLYGEMQMIKVLQVAVTLIKEVNSKLFCVEKHEFLLYKSVCS